MHAGRLSLILLVSASAAVADLQEWEIRTVYEFLICDGPLKPGCKHFAQSDFASALQVFRPLADAGDARAQNNLGVLYESGAGVPESKPEALRWYRKSADAGVALAQHNLAVLIAADHILGTARHPSNRSTDFVEAYVLFTRAASQGLEVASRGRSDLVRNMTNEEIAKAKAQLEKQGSGH